MRRSAIARLQHGSWRRKPLPTKPEFRPPTGASHELSQSALESSAATQQQVARAAHEQEALAAYPIVNAQDRAHSCGASSMPASQLSEDVFCVTCKSGDSSYGNEIILCDGIDESGMNCDAAYHQRCLPVPLRVVPSGTWLCPTCMAAQAGGRWRGGPARANGGRRAVGPPRIGPCFQVAANSLPYLCDVSTSTTTSMGSRATPRKDDVPISHSETEWAMGHWKLRPWEESELREMEAPSARGG